MNKQNHDDRRAHIRIVDKIMLRFQPMNREEYEGLVKKILEGGEHPFDEYSQQCILPKIDAFVRRLREKDEALARILETLDAKLNLILNLLCLRQKKDVPIEKVTVDISAAGLSFPHEDPLEKGQILQLDICLLPEQYFFRCFGEVVRIIKDGNAYKVGVKFIWITECDRERLIEHIFRQQVLQLRLRREIKED